MILTFRAELCSSALPVKSVASMLPFLQRFYSPCHRTGRRDADLQGKGQRVQAGCAPSPQNKASCKKKHKQHTGGEGSISNYMPEVQGAFRRGMQVPAPIQKGNQRWLLLHETLTIGGVQVPIKNQHCIDRNKDKSAIHAAPVPTAPSPPPIIVP